MAIKFNRSETFVTGGTVAAANLHNLVDGLDIYQALITDQTNLTTVGTADSLLIAVASGAAGDAPKKTTVQNLFDDALTSGTYTNFNLTENLTAGTATFNRTVSTSATITTGTIPTLVSTSATITTGTIPTLVSTTGTIATLNSTTGTIATLNSTTGTIATLNSTTGTIATLNSTTGTIATLNSTTGTIGNLSTTIAGDFTISQGTGTLGTTGATLGTYGGATSVPVLAINAKGQVTSTGTAAITSGLTGFRNRIINGDMRIDQRNAGAAQNNLTSGWVYTVDRWEVYSNNSSRFNSQKNKGAISPPSGFKNYLGVSVNTGYSVGASDYNILAQPIEGFNTEDLGFGNSGASTVTLSFLVYTSVTGTHSGFLSNNGLSSAYPFTFTVSSANTWTQVSVTITGSTSGTWVGSTNGIGLYVGFNLGNGSNWQGTANAWNNSGFVQPTSSVSIVATSSANFYITGVQLEAGSTATDFERRPIGAELSLCQRYYEVIISQLCHNTGWSTSINQGFWKATKRSAPTITIANNVGGSGAVFLALSTNSVYQSAANSGIGTIDVRGDAEL